MAQIKTVTTTSGTNSITFDAHYPYIWFKNLGTGDVYVSDNSQAQAGSDDTALLKAGEIIRITAQTDTVYVVGATTVEVHAQGFADCPFKVRVKGGGITVEPLSVTDNGTYTAPSGKAYSPVTVDVQEQPWQPLEDGYSNFWFELTDDTLSPWLNFSAKNDDAVIDWGDGSGEVALDTLTPTHTYSKAGRYVVKVKGVTAIDQQYNAAKTEYNDVLKNVELNANVTTLQDYAFRRCFGLTNVAISSTSTLFGTVEGQCFNFCCNLKAITIPHIPALLRAQTFSTCTNLAILDFRNTGISNISNNAFTSCLILSKLYLPSTLVTIGSNVFAYCYSLKEIHIEATTPPTNNSSFGSFPSNFIIYVPVGTGDTYKAAAGWSTYADHIVEEGQTLSKAALRRIQLAETDESEVR